MKESISVLLAAGFSAPMGYPIGNTLNDKLTSINLSEIGFSSDGRLIPYGEGEKEQKHVINSFDIELEFCTELIKYYNDLKGSFDYEEFYDYIIERVKDDLGAKEISKSKYPNVEFSSLVSGLKNVYNQTVSYYLKDRDGNKWYENRPCLIDKKFDGYTGFLKYLSEIEEDKIVNIHTLNHDLFLESLCSAGFFDGKLSDGFVELGSPYFGTLEKDNRNYNCRLEYFSGEYEGKFRLYKLHGSLDYGLYYKKQGTILIPDQYIKTKYGIGFLEFKKEISNSDDELEYEKCYINYHSDFLTGTTSKIERYSEPLLFKELFNSFKENLKHANKLIIVGYGAKDSEVNNIIKENFDFKNKKSFIIDPFAGETVKSFAKEINAQVIEKQLEIINKTDLE